MAEEGARKIGGFAKKSADQIKDSGVAGEVGNFAKEMVHNAMQTPVVKTALLVGFGGGFLLGIIMGAVLF